MHDQSLKGKSSHQRSVIYKRGDIRWYVEPSYYITYHSSTSTNGVQHSAITASSPCCWRSIFPCSITCKCGTCDPPDRPTLWRKKSYRWSHERPREVNSDTSGLALSPACIWKRLPRSARVPSRKNSCRRRNCLLPFLFIFISFFVHFIMRHFRVFYRSMKVLSDLVRKSAKPAAVYDVLRLLLHSQELLCSVYCFQRTGRCILSQLLFLQTWAKGRILRRLTLICRICL